MLFKLLASNDPASVEQRTHIAAFGSAYSEHQATTRTKIDMHVVPVHFHVLRILGFKRNQPLYGKEGDLIAERFRGLGWDWVDCTTPEPVPHWIRVSRTNEVLAWMIVGTGAMMVALAALNWTRTTFNLHQGSVPGYTYSSTYRDYGTPNLPAVPKDQETFFGPANRHRLFTNHQSYGSVPYREAASTRSLNQGRVHTVVNR